MALTFLPRELLSIVISHTIPEGFESLALTCKDIHVLCTPFIQHHNTLRSQYRHFNYTKTPSRTAFDLIYRIALEPLVARYIRHADLINDSIFIHGEGALAYHRGLNDGVLRLVSESPYLKQAGLDWEVFLNRMGQDVTANQYSQDAASFLLTLLPNVQTLNVPDGWQYSPATDSPLSAIIHTSKQASQPHARSTLSQVTRFEPNI